MKGYFKKIIIICILLLTTLGPSISTLAITNSYESLKGSNPEESYEDLMFLKNELKDKSIIAAGEATHGTGNFYEFKDRLFRFLVKEVGVRAIAIESPMTSCEEINRYILTGEGDVETIVEEGVFAIYATEEFLSLVEWMKEYNDTVDNDKKVRFYGFDVQGYAGTFTPIERFYKKINSDLFENNKYYSNAPYTMVNKVVEDLEVNKDEYIKKSSLEEYTLIKKIADNKKVFSVMDNSDRDTEMKNNILWIQNYEKTFYNNDKIMLWAHNAHISKVEYGDNYAYMGKLLSEELKDKYYSLGFAFYSGKFNISSMYNYNEYEILPGREEGFGGNIHSLFPNENAIYFNVASAREDEKLKSLFSTEVDVYFTGAGTTSSKEILEGEPYNIGKSYDGLVYFKETFPCHYLSEMMELDKKIVVSSTIIGRIINENGLGITIIGFGFIVLGILVCISIGKKMFKDNKYMGNLEVKGKRILGIFIIFYIISDIFFMITKMLYGILGIGNISLYAIDIMLCIYLFKGKKLARFLFITKSVMSILCSMYLVVMGNYNVLTYILIMVNIVMIAILSLKSVKSYFAYCNPNKDTDVELDEK